MKTLLKRTCEFEVSGEDPDIDPWYVCGKPAVEKVLRAHSTGWLCAEHFELVSLFESLHGRAVKTPSNNGG